MSDPGAAGFSGMNEEQSDDDESIVNIGPKARACPIPTPKPFWRRGLAGFLDFVTIFFLGGYAIAMITGETTPDGFHLNGASALACFGLVALYFYLGWKKLGGTIWQRILKAR
jgi:hypothetical protein